MTQRYAPSPLFKNGCLLVEHVILGSYAKILSPLNENLDYLQVV